ncbi:MAG: aromatic-ring-hydroxylating dioxygenase subunit beta [Alcaligenes sp.]
MSEISRQALIDFVYAESRLLDEQRYEQWLDLFTEDGYYWMPLVHDQQDARLHASLMHEDKLLLRIRVERLTGRRTFSQQPKSRSHHLIQQPTVESLDEEKGEYTVRCAFHYTETRGDSQDIYVGWSTYTLVRQDDALKIRLKRVDLLNCDAPFGNIQLFM